MELQEKQMEEMLNDVHDAHEEDEDNNTAFASEAGGDEEEEEADGGGGDEQVSVRFVSKMKDPALRVAPTPYFVPVQLTRYNLSLLVNEILDLEQRRPFDFLINATFLRTSLFAFMQKHNLGKEDTLTLEYVEALAAPEHQKDFEHDDWIADVCGSDKVVVSGSYDKSVRVWDTAGVGAAMVTIQAHAQPVTSVSWLTKPTDNEISFITASKDHTIRSWLVDLNKKVHTARHVFKSHTGSVEALATEPSFARFCSGSWDRTIKLWDPASTEGDEERIIDDNDSGKSLKKKARVDESTRVEKGCIRTFKGHNQAVACLDWTIPETIYSGSWDHSIRSWDVESGVNTRTLVGEKVVHSVAYSTEAGVIASAHNDKHIRLWDPRSTVGEVMKSKLTSHHKWVYSLRWHPTRTTLLASASYDGTVKLWDVRSSTPLHTLPSLHKGKVLCVAWAGERKLVSGGADSKLKLNAVPVTQN